LDPLSSLSCPRLLTTPAPPAAAQYIASLLAERWLRHVDRIPAHGIRNRRVVIYDLCAILFCCIGSAALVVLSAFNCYS
jgi:hypothetical protein